MARGGEECTLPETKGRPHLSAVANTRDPLTQQVSRSSLCFGQGRSFSRSHGARSRHRQPLRSASPISTPGNFPRNCRRHITSQGFKRQPLPLALRIPCGPRVGAISQQEKFSALERKAEGPFRTVARSFATTSARTLATLSLGDAARSGEAPAAVASAPALLRPSRGGLESAVGEQCHRPLHELKRACSPR